MPDLFELVDLPSWLKTPEVDTETATRVRRAANGWLQDATGLTAWPDPVPDVLWAWGIELAAIAMRNPDGAATANFDDYTYVADRERRNEILAAARKAYRGGEGGEGQPQWSFPEPDWHWKATTAVLPD